MFMFPLVRRAVACPHWASTATPSDRALAKLLAGSHPLRVQELFPLHIKVKSGVSVAPVAFFQADKAQQVRVVRSCSALLPLCAGQSEKFTAVRTSPGLFRVTIYLTTPQLER